MLNEKTRWRYSYTLLMLCWFGWITIYICRSVLPPILPILYDELNISHAQGGILETAYLLGYIVVKIPAGFVANRIGIKKTLIFSMMGYALSTSFNFLAVNFAHLFILRFFVGLFQGVHLPLANTLLSEKFGDKQRRAIGFHESGPNIGNSIAFPLTVAIVSALNWRWAFLIISIPAFMLAGVATFILRDDKKSESSNKLNTENNGQFSLKDFSRILIPLAIAHSVYNLCLRTLITFSPSYLVEFKGMSLAMAGIISMFMPATGFIAKISSGFISEIIGSKNVINSAMFLSGILILTTSYLPNYGLSINFIALGLVLYSFSPIIYSSVTSVLPTQLKSLGLGIVTMIGNVSGALSAFFVGYLIDIKGYQFTFFSVSIVVLISSIIFLVMKD